MYIIHVYNDVTCFWLHLSLRRRRRRRDDNIIGFVPGLIPLLPPRYPSTSRHRRLIQIWQRVVCCCCTCEIHSSWCTYERGRGQGRCVYNTPGRPFWRTRTQIQLVAIKQLRSNRSNHFSDYYIDIAATNQLYETLISLRITWWHSVRPISEKIRNPVTNPGLDIVLSWFEK